jgi:hypothetical protein
MPNARTLPLAAALVAASLALPSAARADAPATTEAPPVTEVAPPPGAAPAPPSVPTSAPRLFLQAGTGLGPGFFHYFSGGGAAGLVDVIGFSFHVNACGGARFGALGVGAAVQFQPLIGDKGGFAPGGFGGICLTYAASPRIGVSFDTGFGGMGVSKVFGGIGPAWSPSFQIEVLRDPRGAVTVGGRLTVMYLWEPDNSRADPSIYVTPQVQVGLLFE